MTATGWVQRHPIAAFILVAMLWSWSIWSLLFLFIKPGGLLQNPPPITFVFVVVGGFGPTISGLLITYLVYGRSGMQALGRRLRHWQVGRWWAALLVIPAITAITPLLRWLAGYPVDFSAMLSLLIPGLLLGLTAGLMEEFGWRGFLLPHLLKRYAPFAASLLVGLIWGGLWHGYADYFGLGGKGLAFWPLMLLVGPILLSAWALVLTRVYQGTQGSLLLSILMHASLSSSALIFGQTYATLSEEILWTAISVGVAWLGSMLFWWMTRRAIVEGL
ncbi:MAG: CPBP family intramembrane metalloprotease [Anaerolineales bacterium]|nr:CPBP family intramembrane metalloprotease [Anaerolineales bacterium]